MEQHLRRKGSIGTLVAATEWLRRNPVLIVIFLLYGLLEAFSNSPGTLGLLFAVAAFLAVIYVDGLAHVIGEQEARGASSDIARASTTVRQRYLSLFGATVVYVLAVAAGLIFFVLPGLYLAVRLSLAFPACVIDDQDAVESLKTSWTVADGNLAKLVGISLTWLFVFLGGMVVAFVATDLSVTDLNEGFSLTYFAATVVLTAIGSPIVQLAYARVYLENRPHSETDAGETDRREQPSWGATDDGTQTERGDDRWRDDD
ncbi:glycerophosphoryl diester phosphodiesterase membrane domain-containing protein [Natrinema sp. SYSU A 869]|uniref:DUF7847 domain-containing protein n=1 Tax=Natrinema sp. SYSU A 869 TaxID=2871694 RepID=UPI001CA44271|nr:glycerophosphoryl diester phosphodiesterase membrane domain-containing protein [Natrinema sp. SYSU A 869]